MHLNNTLFEHVFHIPGYYLILVGTCYFNNLIRTGAKFTNRMLEFLYWTSGHFADHRRCEPSWTSGLYQWLDPPVSYKLNNLYVKVLYCFLGVQLFIYELRFMF